MKRATCCTGLVCAALLGAAASVSAQRLTPYPLLREGEVLQYQVQSTLFGTVGSARLQVELDSLSDQAAYRITLDLAARVPGYFVSVQTHSWVDTETMSTLYLTRCVQTPAGQRAELVDIAASLNAWSDSAGAHPLDSAEPLDELALFYLLRALPVSDSLESLRLDRHFDAARNPVRIRRLGRAAVVALGTTHQATIMELQVGPNAGDTKPLVAYISNDAARLPLRIELALPGVGAMSLLLQSASDARRIALAGTKL